MGRAYRADLGPERRLFVAALHAVARRLATVLAALVLAPFRRLPSATIGTQITLLSLVTTVPFLVLIIVWSVQDAEGLAHTVAGAIWATSAAIGLGALSHRRLSLPIAQLSRTAQRIGQGNFATRAPFHRHDELGELAAAMDAMTANIESLTDELLDTRNRVVQAIAEVGRLTTSGIDAEELWPVLADIARRLTSADGSAVYARSSDGALQLRASAGINAWPARGDLADQLAGERQQGDEGAPVWADRRMAAPLVVNRCTTAVLEVYRTATPFPHDTERLLGVFARQAALAVERTQLRRQAAEAFAWERTSRTQREFIAMASHELRNPVASLRSYAEALRLPAVALDDTERQYCLERIDHLTGRLGDIVRNLLSASRMRAGQLHVELTTVDLARLTHGVVTDMRRRAPAVTLTEQFSPDLPSVRADPVCLEEIVVNLLSNALRFTPPGGEVQLRSEATVADGALRVRLHLRDDGPGLSRDQQSRLFQRFARLDGEPMRGRGQSGLGLGLFLCQNYAQLMHGSIGVTSELGKGATFTVDLPAAAGAEETINEP